MAKKISAKLLMDLGELARESSKHLSNVFADSKYFRGVKRFYDSFGTVLTNAGLPVERKLPRAKSETVDLLLLRYYAGKSAVSVMEGRYSGSMPQLSTAEKKQMRPYLDKVDLNRFLTDKTLSYDEFSLAVVDLVFAGGKYYKKVLDFMSNPKR